jgi:predicted acetyltransferase
MDIYLEVPTIEREKDAMDYIIEFFANGSVINGTGGLDSYYNQYEEWLKSLDEYSSKETVPEGKVSSNTYFAVRKEDNKIIGMVNIRHYLNNALIENGGGHIGYSVRPEERRKGYADKILKLSLEKCCEFGIEKIHVGCNAFNVGSYKTIEKNGGILLREFIDKKNIPHFEYIIDIKKI